MAPSVNNTNPSLSERIESWRIPSILMYRSAIGLLSTILKIIFIQRDLTLLLQPDTVRHQAFGEFWLKYGACMSEDIPPATEKDLHQLSGLVLDVGPGSGELLNRYSNTNVAAAYGAEPSVVMHPRLLNNADKLGWNGRYRALACGAEPQSLIPALAKEGLLEGGASQGVFDHIVCLRVLCGVPNPEETIAGLYRLLKPGGKLTVLEHVKNPWRSAEGSLISRGFQILYSALGWRVWMGGCELQRDTKKMLLEAGGRNGWAEHGVHYVDAWGVVPFVHGSLIKAS